MLCVKITMYRLIIQCVAIEMLPFDGLSGYKKTQSCLIITHCDTIYTSVTTSKQHAAITQSPGFDSISTQIFHLAFDKTGYVWLLLVCVCFCCIFLSAVVEQWMRRKLYSVLENNKHPLHSILAGQRNSCSERLISLHCRTERFRRSFIPTAIRLFNSDCWHVLLKVIYLFSQWLLLLVLVVVLLLLSNIQSL